MVAGQAFAAPGDLDTTFSGDGKQTTSFGAVDQPPIWLVPDAAPAPGGKTIVAGEAGTHPITSIYDVCWGRKSVVAVARYNGSGALDTTFSGDGKLTTNLSTECEYAQGVVVQGDGKPVAVGVATSLYPDGRREGSAFVVRYTADGALDTTFSGDGWLMLEIDPYVKLELAEDVAIQADGKIVVVGNGVARLHPNGDFDLTFDEDGILQDPLVAAARSVAIQPDAKIVVGGSTYDYDTGASKGIVTRLTPIGTLDTSFSGDGAQVIAYSGTAYGDDDVVNDVAIAGDKIVATGRYYTDASVSDISVMRLNSDGTMDTTFSGDGKQKVSVGAYDAGAAVAVASDGKIIAAGTGQTTSGGMDFAVVRLTSGGEPDTSFSGDGKLTTDFGASDRGGSVFVHPADGKIVAAGRSAGNFALARYLSAGTSDTAPPAVRAPAQAMLVNSTLGTSAVPVRISWSASDSSGVSRYGLQQSINGGAWSNVALPTATTTSITPSLTPSRSYQYRVQAQDKAGNWSGYVSGAKFTVVAVQENASTVAYSGTWLARASKSGAYGGYVRPATASGAKATYGFSGRNVSVVMPKASNLGNAKVCLYRGTTQIVCTTTDLSPSAGLGARKVVFTRAGLSPASTYKLVISNAGGRIELDAIVVLK